MAKRKPVSIRDVARESNASLTTVSLVLNKRDGRISSATRERVLKAVDKLRACRRRNPVFWRSSFPNCVTSLPTPILVS